MINFKNRNGFTLIEVLITLAIIGMVLTPLIIAQSTALRSITTLSRRMTRFIYAKNFLLESSFKLLFEKKEQEKEAKQVGELKDPPMKLTYELKQVSENSALARFKGLKIGTVFMRWQERTGPRTDKLIQVILKPDEEKK